MGAHLRALGDAFDAAPSFDEATLEAALRQVAEARGVKAAMLIHATRVAVTGKAASPGLFEVLVLLGRERIQRRFIHATSLAAM
jgi:glutamyl-tRNA synthetase